jgi:hypothetical protein
MANATVTLCHSRTVDLAQLAASADILIAAIGRPKFVTASMIKPGAAVVDVGINRTDDGLVGDVDFDAAYTETISGCCDPKKKARVSDAGNETDSFVWPSVYKRNGSDISKLP